MGDAVIYRLCVVWLRLIKTMNFHFLFVEVICAEYYEMAQLI